MAKRRKFTSEFKKGKRHEDGRAPYGIFKNQDGQDERTFKITAVSLKL